MARCPRREGWPKLCMAKPPGVQWKIPMVSARLTIELNAAARNISAVAASAGKNDSIASSDSVTSTGVPNIVVVENSDSVPASVTKRSGTTTPAYSSFSVGARRISRRRAPDRRRARRAAGSARASAVTSICWRSRVSRCARHSARFSMRGASPFGCRLSRSTLTGGCSSDGIGRARAAAAPRHCARSASSGGRSRSPGRARVP